MLQHLRLLFQSVSVETLLDFVQTAIQGQSSARKCVQFLDVQSILHASHHLFQAFSRRSTCKKVHLSAQWLEYTLFGMHNWCWYWWLRCCCCLCRYSTLCQLQCARGTKSILPLLANGLTNRCHTLANIHSKCFWFCFTCFCLFFFSHFLDIRFLTWILDSILSVFMLLHALLWIQTMQVLLQLATEIVHQIRV